MHLATINMLLGKKVFQEANFYGAANLIFAGSQLPSCFKATWMHGLGPVFFRENSDPKVLLNFDEEHLPIHLVNNQHTKNLLESYGYHSQAIGMPILYTAHYSARVTKDIKRLYMPSHILGNLRIAERIKRWPAMIKKYGCDAICLSQGDYEYVIKHDINLSDVLILQGAHPKNPNSLENIASYFARTSELITDSSGSHIPYATAMGVHVPVIDELKISAESKENVLRNIPKNLKENFANHMKKNPLREVINLWGSRDDNAKLEYSKNILGVEFIRPKAMVQSLLTPENYWQETGILTSLLRKKLWRKFQNKR